MVHNSFEVLHADDGMHVLLDLKRREIIPFHSDGCMERLLQHLLRGWLAPMSKKRLRIMMALTVTTHNFFGKAGKIDELVFVGMNVKILDSRTKMIHKLA